jgi:hypothetical protein
LEQLPDPEPENMPEWSDVFDYSDEAAKEWAQTMLNLDGSRPPFLSLKFAQDDEADEPKTG